MPAGIYDSPTFLSQKDTYIAGMTLPQLMVCMVIGLIMFLFSLALPFGFVVRLAFVIPGTGLGAFVCFGKIYGLSVPGFLITALTFPFRSSVYEQDAESSLRGDPAWLARREASAAGNAGRLDSVRSRAGQAAVAMDSHEVQVKRAEAKAEASAKVDEGARSLERFVRDGVRALFKSG